MSKLFFLLPFLFISQLYAQTAPRGDSVQAILQELSVLNEEFEVVKQIPETGRWYLTLPHDEVPDILLESIQDAFLYDIILYCQYYGWKYMIDWRVLASKAARESFWGTSYLANRSFNYFGIRASQKNWACQTFRYCQHVVRNDPQPSAFIVFPDFSSSLWMFLHTIYSRHYLERLPDEGETVLAAIEAERAHGQHYWMIDNFDDQLRGDLYTPRAIINTWSGYAINNFCRNCNRRSDLQWIEKIDRVAERRGEER
ncbi:MAG: glucosaminidase domain-containing protein [Bacteroidota bacterium]